MRVYCKRTGCDASEEVEYGPLHDYHTVTFDADNGTEPVKVLVDLEKAAEKPEKDPVKEHYTFQYWYIFEETPAESEGNDEKEEVPPTPYDFDAVVTEDLILKAYYTANKYTVKFVSGNGTEIEPQTVTYPGLITRPADPEQEDNSVLAWITDAGEPFDFTTAPESDLTLTARWEKQIYVVRYYMNETYIKIEYITSGHKAKGVPLEMLTDNKHASGVKYYDSLALDAKEVSIDSVTMDKNLFCAVTADKAVYAGENGYDSLQEAFTAVGKSEKAVVIDIFANITDNGKAIGIPAGTGTVTVNGNGNWFTPTKTKTLSFKGSAELRTLRIIALDSKLAVSSSAGSLTVGNVLVYSKDIQLTAKTGIDISGLSQPVGQALKLTAKGGDLTAKNINITEDADVTITGNKNFSADIDTEEIKIKSLTGFGKVKLSGNITIADNGKLNTTELTLADGTYITVGAKAALTPAGTLNAGENCTLELKADAKPLTLSKTAVTGKITLAADPSFANKMIAKAGKDNIKSAAKFFVPAAADDIHFITANKTNVVYTVYAIAAYTLKNGERVPLKADNRFTTLAEAYKQYKTDKLTDTLVIELHEDVTDKFTFPSKCPGLVVDGAGHTFTLTANTLALKMDTELQNITVKCTKATETNKWKLKKGKFTLKLADDAVLVNGVTV